MKYCFLIFLFFITCRSFSQDTILKYNGEIIQAKINEITPTEVKYKRFNFQDGPLYVESKSDIKMIKYSNGLKEEFTPELPQAKVNPNPLVLSNEIEPYGPFYKVKGQILKENQIHQLLLDTKDKKIMSLVAQAKEAKAMQYIGFLAIPLGIATMVSLNSLNNTSIYVPTSSSSNNNSSLILSGFCFAGAITCPIISGVYKQKRNNYNRAAVRLYNEKF